MSDPVELLLSRLDRPRRSGRDRWRAVCPVCGERNHSTLSVGIGDNGCVLLKCFKSDCDVDEIARAVGLALEELFPPMECSGRPLARRRLLPAWQALQLLEEEATLLWVVGSDLARGKAPDKATLDRVVTAVGRIGALRQEVRA